jgi:regulator of replication initiation timing
MSKKDQKNKIEIDASSDDSSDSSSKISEESSFFSSSVSSDELSSIDDSSTNKSNLDLKDKFSKLEIELTICRKNIADMSKRIFDLEDESNNIKISNIDILQKLDEQKKLIDVSSKEKSKSLHFISRRNDFI